jgi:hypothetical protein
MSISTSASVTSRNRLAGEPMMTERSGNSLRSVIDAILADDRVAQDRRADADQRTIADAAAVDYGAVADRYLVADHHRRVAVYVDGGIVLHVRALTDRDRVEVAAKHGAEPYIRIAAEGHATDDRCARRDEKLIAGRDHSVLPEVVKHFCGSDFSRDSY